MTNLEGAPRQTLIRMADIASTPTRRGLTGLSEMTIRRYIAAGNFPQSRKYGHSRAVFFVYGEVLDWMDAQIQGGDA